MQAVEHHDAKICWNWTPSEASSALEVLRKCAIQILLTYLLTYLLAYLLTSVGSVNNT